MYAGIVFPLFDFDFELFVVVCNYFFSNLFLFWDLAYDSKVLKDGRLSKEIIITKFNF